MHLTYVRIQPNFHYYMAVEVSRILQVSQQVAVSMTPSNQIPEDGIMVIKIRTDLINGTNTK
jgi:hypothetical protein